MAIIKVKTGGITADAITDALIADDVVGTEHLTANEVDTTALGADAVTGAQLADDAVNSEHYTDGSVDTAHIADVNVTQAKIADQAINEAKMQISNGPTNGYALTAQSGNTGGLTWAEIGGGKILQVIQGTDTTELSTTSTSLVDTGLSVNITPSSSSNKILVLADVQGQMGANVGWGGSIVRGSTVILETNTYSNYGGDSQQNMRSSYVKLDSPSSTSELTYKTQVKCYNPGTVLINEGSNPTTITVMEIKG